MKKIKDKTGLILYNASPVLIHLYYAVLGDIFWTFYAVVSNLAQFSGTLSISSVVLCVFGGPTDMVEVLHKV